jgi:hypothetical protein
MFRSRLAAAVILFLAASYARTHVGVDDVSTKYDHIHVKGKVTTPKGEPIPGVRILGPNGKPVPTVQGFEQWAVFCVRFTWGGWPTGSVPAQPLLTGPDGTYEFIIYRQHNPLHDTGEQCKKGFESIATQNVLLSASKTAFSFK